jgi:NitT/TauT family transport system substrate-binding protein
MMKLTASAAALAALFGLIGAPARAEVSELAVAQQYGVAFLPLMVMEKQELTEKIAKEKGLALKVNWLKLAGPSSMNDGLLSDTIHFAAQGAPSLITLWDRTRGKIGVKAMSAMTTYPLYFVSRNPELKSLKDLSEKDKIAVPSVKISTQAIMLQIAATQLFGQKEYARFDPLTISLSHPDGLLAIMNNTAGVNAHFTTSPFYEQEMKLPGARLITTNYDIMGGPTTALVLTATTKFRETNPKAYRSFFEALSRAIDIVNADKRAAAQLYIEMANDRKTPLDELVETISHKDYRYTLRPDKVLQTAQFMASIGSIKQAPKSVEEMFFPEGAGLNGD